MKALACQRGRATCLICSDSVLAWEEGWFSVIRNCCEHVKVVDVIEYRFVCAVNDDNLQNTENEYKSLSGLFHIGENDYLDKYDCKVCLRGPA